jgi:hypothetical protein
MLNRKLKKHTNKLHISITDVHQLIKLIVLFSNYLLEDSLECARLEVYSFLVVDHRDTVQ